MIAPREEGHGPDSACMPVESPFRCALKIPQPNHPFARSGSQVLSIQ